MSLTTSRRCMTVPKKQVIKTAHCPNDGCNNMMMPSSTRCVECYRNSIRRSEPRDRSHLRDDQVYWKHRRRIREDTKVVDGPCRLCGGSFDWDAHYLDPYSFTIHHLVDRYDGGDRNDPANMVPAHLTCNQKAGGEAIRRRAQTEAGGWNIGATSTKGRPVSKGQHIADGLDARSPRSPTTGLHSDGDYAVPTTSPDMGDGGTVHGADTADKVSNRWIVT